MKATKILFVVTEDWYFYSHRLQLAIAAKEAGYDVALATRLTNHKQAIEQSGIRTIPLVRMKRSSLNPVRELTALLEILSIFRKERPDLVHLVALKPVIYGSIAAKYSKVYARVNALGGLGFIFSSRSKVARVLKPLLIRVFRFIFNDKRSRLILQNLDDMVLMVNEAKVNPANIRLIRSAGVNLKEYVASELPAGIPIIMLASRMIWNKGVQEFVDSANILANLGLKARFVLVGDPDPENPSSLSESQLKKWQEEKIVEWWGHQTDMPTTLSLASIVCLPSYYGEGVPKVLIEAMACGRAIITTNTPGCKDLVKVGSNGLLVEPRDASDLAEKIAVLVRDRDLCQRMGNESHVLAAENFSISRVAAETLDIYDALLTGSQH